MDKSLLEAIEASDVTKASNLLARSISQGGDPWKIHLSLFPVVQTVMNPPFINPHLPKMYGISRELIPFLGEKKVASFVHLEVSEYARRPKMEQIPKGNPLVSPVAFKEIEASIKENDPGKAAVLMSAFLDQRGGAEFARKLLILGSAYLNHSLGHSVSCTALILTEMLQRKDMDPWPALSVLASYFCKGRFHTSPVLFQPARQAAGQSLDRQLFRATSGKGIVNLHHTITRYAIERVRTFLSQEDYFQMMNAWIDFLGDKPAESISLKGIESGMAEDYDQFYKIFSTLNPEQVVASLRGLIGSEAGRHKVKSFLVTGFCDKYQGDYNPHYLTGLGSALWVLDQYWKDPLLVNNALFQYLDFFFTGLKS
jgi:hypothetical protein